MRSKWIQRALATIITIGGLWLLYLIFQKIWTVFSGLNPTVATSIVAASATIVVSFISVRISKHLDQKALIIKEHREKKVPVYEKMIKLIFELTFAEKLGNERPTEKDMIEHFAEFTQDIVIWGSDEMIEAFYKFKKATLLEESEENNNIMFVVEDLLLAIRKDLGHKNKNVGRGKILGLFVNDIEAFL